MAYKRTRSADIQVLLAGGSRIGARSIAALSAALLRAITVVMTLAVPAMADGGAGGQGGDPSAAGGIGGSGFGGASGGNSGPSTTAGSGGGGGGAAGGGNGGSSGNTASVGGAAGGTSPGQDGSNGTTASSPSGGGGGAGGNNGGEVNAPYTNTATSTGQKGGKGGDGGAGTDSGSTGGGGGGGGSGGVGFVFSDSSSFTNFNVTIQGGAGGTGGAGGSAAAANGNGGAGGDGGTGLLLTSPGATVTNRGAIKGGNGGVAGAAGAGTGTAGAAGAAGAGGAGIVGSGLTIINSMSIQGGLAGDGTTRANSITFTGGDNTLTFMNAGAGLFGAIGLATSSTTLTFAQSANSILDQMITGAGSVTKTGSGVLTLSGLNTYTGGTTISAGTLQLGTGSNTGSITGDVINNASLVFNRSGTYAFGGAISGTGGVSKAGIGTVVLTGTNTYSGGTTISAGILQIGNGGSTGSIAGDVINRASLVFNRLGTYTFGGAISGTGSVRKTGAGVTILTGANTYTGVTTISSGVLQIGDGGTAGSITGQVSNNSELWFNRSDAYTFGGVISGGGSVSQLGPGTTVLTGNSNYTGGTTISNGTLQIGDGGTTGSIANNVTNNGTLAFNRSNALTFFGLISGTGAVAQLGSGNLTLSRANTYTGGTTISGGTVTVGNNSALGAGDVKMTQGASLAFGNADYTIANNFVVSGTSIFDIRTGTIQTITGAVSDGDTAGIIEKNGGGKLILNGRNSFSGGTIINAGTLQLANSNMLSATTAATVASGTTLDLGGFDQTIGSLAGGGSVALGAAMLTTGADNSSTNYSGMMSGTGGLTKQGTGNLILSGTNEYTGPTTINAGTLSVNGSIASAVTAASGGRLGGSGSVGSTTIASGGTLAPGNSIGTLTINGDLSFAAGSSYAVEVSPTASDRTNVTGRATLAGTVQASYASGSYISKRYTIVNAGGGVAGTFGALVDTNLPANFTSALAYDANNAYLNLALAFVPPTAPDYGNGLSRNQQQVAGVLVNSFNVAGGIPTTLGTLKPDGLSQVSGEAGAALQQSLFGSADLFMRSVFSNALDPVDGSAGRECAAPGSQAGPRDACAALPPAAASASRWSVWGVGYGGTLRVGGDASTGSHDTTSRVAGAAAGASYQLSPQARVGLALGGSGSSFSLAQGLGSGSSDNFNAALYGRYQIGPSYLAAALGYVWQDATVDRTVTVAGGEALRARMHPQALTARVEGGQRLQVSGIGVTPYAALQTTTMFLPTFGETGTSVFALDYAGRQPTVTRSELGARFDDEVFIDGRPLALRARAAWAHGWNTDWQAAATLRQIPAAQFNVYGVALPGDSVQVSLGACLGLGRGWTVSAAFDGEFWKHADSYAGRALVSYQW
ncbi:autotransporter-associated beta strand repeat-containing protein [Rhodopseudomonas sp. P1]|uniref:autotransporter-associated beta strand repeat-containing protein n=1 Tax=Rhodopseudomonas sp. P1 TaxID=3434357 RepID=UPI0031FE30E8